MAIRIENGELVVYTDDYRPKHIPFLSVPRDQTIGIFCIKNYGHMDFGGYSIGVYLRLNLLDAEDPSDPYLSEDNDEYIGACDDPFPDDNPYWNTVGKQLQKMGYKTDFLGFED